MPFTLRSWNWYFDETGHEYVPGVGEQPCLVLRNIPGIKNPRVLQGFESHTRVRKARAIRNGDIEIPQTYDNAHLYAIHRALFEEVYTWAGVPRAVTMSVKIPEVPITGADRLRFVHPYMIDDELSDVMRRIQVYDWASIEEVTFATSIANYYSEIDAVHPFREGNGLATMLFMEQVSELSPWRVDLDFRKSRAYLQGWKEDSRLATSLHPSKVVPDIRTMSELASLPRPLITSDTLPLAGIIFTRTRPSPFPPRQIRPPKAVRQLYPLPQIQSKLEEVARVQEYREALPVMPSEDTQTGRAARQLAVLVSALKKIRAERDRIESLLRGDDLPAGDQFPADIVGLSNDGESLTVLARLAKAHEDQLARTLEALESQLESPGWYRTQLLLPPGEETQDNPSGNPSNTPESPGGDVSEDTAFGSVGADSSPAGESSDAS